MATRSRILLKSLALVGALASLALLSGCADLPQSTVFPKGDQGRDVLSLYKIIFVLAMVVFVVVEGLLLVAVIKFRSNRTDILPAQTHGNQPLEIGWTIAPAVILLAIAVPTWQTIFAHAKPAPDNAVVVDVIGHQWWWEFKYPGLGVVTASELHLPVDVAADFRIQSTTTDVIHSFWVPQLGGKQDAIPGRINHLVITPEEVGIYNGQCVEFCGASHANMRLIAVIQTQADFDKWVASQKAAPAAATGDAQKGMDIFLGATPEKRACWTCHVVTGTKAVGTTGPNLTHVGSRGHIAGAILENTTENLHTWLQDPPAVKPGSKMPNLHLSDDEINNLVAYLQSLK